MAASGTLTSIATREGKEGGRREEGEGREANFTICPRFTKKEKKEKKKKPPPKKPATGLTSFSLLQEKGKRRNKNESNKTASNDRAWTTVSTPHTFNIPTQGKEKRKGKRKGDTGKTFLPGFFQGQKKGKRGGRKEGGEREETAAPLSGLTSPKKKKGKGGGRRKGGGREKKEKKEGRVGKWPALEPVCSELSRQS